MSRLDPKGSTRGNRHMPLSGSQFLETQTKTRKTSGIPVHLKKKKQFTTQPTKYEKFYEIV